MFAWLAFIIKFCWYEEYNAYLGACMDAVGNTNNILVFAQTKMSMEVNPHMEDTLYKENFM